MANLHRAVLGMLVLQMYVHAAPSDISKLEDIAKVEHAEAPPEILAEESTSDDSKPEGARQKRFYNYYGYGFPPINPLIYPNYGKRDSSADIGGYGYEDPFVDIHRRLQEIANVVRQPVPPPPPPHFPIFFPVIFIPQAGCQCFPDTTNQPVNPPTNTNQSNPDVVNRFPEMDDVRQNWGLVVNETEDDDYDEGDGSRPISFDPIRVNNTLMKPAPPVEHGSVQSDSQTPVTTTSRSVASGFNLGAAFAPPAASSSAPSNCDGAVLSCCHQQTVTYDCFAIQGCPDPTSYGNPCAPNVILTVIDKFQRFYGKRNQ